jgi:Neuraminidase (sialidase)
MDWQGILQASLATVMQTTPSMIGERWSGDGPNGKINNALQILQDAATTGATIEKNLQNSPAAQKAHPEILSLAQELQSAQAAAK